MTAKKSTLKTVKTKSKSKTASAKKPTVKKKVAKSAVIVGKEIGSFLLNSTGGKQIDLSNLKGKNIVLYFYPKDDTPGCTIEGKDFTRLHDSFTSANTEVYGISRDSVESHEKFRNKYCYTIDLLSDADEKLCKHFGVIRPKNMYGKMVIGIERSTFVIDSSGKLVREWRKVRVDGHADEVLDFVKTL
jgi:peroxiredoxin Q/BCP